MRLPATLVTIAMPWPLTFSNTTTGFFPACSSFEHQRGCIEPQIDRLANAQQLVRMLGLHQVQEPTQALPVDVDVSLHDLPLMRPPASQVETLVEWPKA